MRFRALIQAGGKTAAGIEVPPEIVDRLGAGRKPPVRVTIAGHSYRSSIATMGGVFMVGVTNEFRRESGVAAGDTVDVDIEVDTEPREVAVPADLAEALDADPEARAFFDGLSYSNKRRIAEPIAAIKSPETRQRRIERTVAGLHDHRV
jgi:bacteriocin resistance YdeI/OmpD-like protein/uncharacterized protein DUF1905